MKTLVLMRHAKSSWKEAGVPDHDRPLNKRGRRAAPRMGELLAEQGPQPDVLLSSTALRARSTAEQVAETCGSRPEVKLLEKLYLAAPADYLEAIRQQPASQACVMVVGHNPGLENLLEQLSGVRASLPTAAVAAIELDLAAWSNLDTDTRGRLVSLWRPRELE